MRIPIARRYALLMILAGTASMLVAADTPLPLRDPTMNHTTIVFSYAGDLWSVPRGGGDARRLTTGPGTEATPHFSPDGTQIAFTGEYDIGAESEDPYVGGTSPSVNNSLVRQVNKYLSGNSQPHRLVIAGNYRLPTLNTNKFLSWAIRDWTFGAVFQYQSGQPIRVPYANNQLGTLLKLCAPVNVMFAGCQGTGTFANRVPGEPLFSADLNNKNVDPNTTFFLNPDAWEDPPPGQYGISAAYYDDYRYQRLSSESMSLGRIFRIGERANLNIRIEFTNLFNRTQKGNPSSTNAGATQRVDSNGKPLSGFGYINTGRLAAQPRMGQLVARVQF